MINHVIQSFLHSSFTNEKSISNLSNLKMSQEDLKIRIRFFTGDPSRDFILDKQLESNSRHAQYVTTQAEKLSKDFCSKVNVWKSLSTQNNEH